MKEFAVTVPWRVVGLPADEQIVLADYFRIIDGALIFRNSRFRNDNDDGYPRCVHAFAAGEWSQVRPKEKDHE